MSGQPQTDELVDGSLLTCEELVALVTDYFDGAMTESERFRFDAHLDLCNGCRNHLEQVKSAVSVLHRLGDDDLPTETRDRLLLAFRTWKRTGK